MHNAIHYPHWYKHQNIKTNRLPYAWVTENTRKFMAMGYLDKGVTPEQRAQQIVDSYYKRMIAMNYPEDVARDKASTLLTGVEQGWVSFATPVWVSYGNDKGLPISCFGSSIGNESMEDILFSACEIGMLTKYGGGTSIDLNVLRSRGTDISVGGKADGAAHFAGLFNSIMKIARQGEARRGYCAAYLDASHGDINEFLEVGRDSSELQNITTAVSFSDDFLEKALAGSEHEQEVVTKTGKVRSELGYPYVLFKDNVNRNKPQVYIDKDMDINMSNLCSEIMLPNSVEESFVCVLSSLNLVHYDEWKDTAIVETMISFLDTVVEESIVKIRELEQRRSAQLNGKLDNVSGLFLQRIQRFLVRHRALGLGTMGLHHLYQSKLFPFESTEAARLNNEIFKNIRTKAESETEYLATLLGEPEILTGYGKRNTTLLAIAPTKSSASIMGYVSESIQPELSNYYLADLAKDTVIVRNPYLTALLESYGRNVPATWDKILETDSVQHLDFLSAHEKEVFKTFAEISPRAIIDQASIRQTYIDQGQSLNLIFHPDATADEINAWFFYAWKMGIKALYYQNGISPAQLNNIAVMKNNRECVACSA